MEDSGKKSSKQYETYKKVSTLGKGSFGEAFLVECQSNKQLAVIKQVDITEMNEDERKETLREAKILEVLNHPNIIKFKEVYKTKKGKLCIVMDYADGGDLQQKIKEKYTKKQKTGTMDYFTENQVLNWFTQICLALKHCHDRKILHRDLKSQNIFLTSKGLVKLGDFGIARVLGHTKSKASTVVGTPYYLSPEIIENKPYSFKSDVWSLGVLLYEMCACQPPFNASSLHQLASKILACKYERIPPQFSNKVQQIIQLMLVKDPSQRPTVNELLQIPIIEERISNYLVDNDFRDEFSHTLLHNQDVFQEFQKQQDFAKKQKEEQELQTKLKKQQEEEEAARLKMEKMYIDQYKAPVAYQSQYSNQEFFNDQYINYIYSLQKDLTQENSKSKQQQQTYIPQSILSQVDSEDREDKEEYESPAFKGQQTKPVDMGISIDEIDIYSCTFDQFKQQMSQQYGVLQFTEGYNIILKNINLIYTDEGEAQLAKLLQHLFKEIDTIKGFINYCSSYLIVQNYSQQIKSEQF